MNSRKKVIVAGAGPAGLMASWWLADQFEVHLFEKEKMPGQKFLLAGKGGLNITNRLTGEALAAKYQPREFLCQAVTGFDSQHLRAWLAVLGIPTFEGSSGRIFPEKGITPAAVLNRIVDSLRLKGVVFHMRHTLISFGPGDEYLFSSPSGQVRLLADYAVFAFGGASWPITGSDGRWTAMMNGNGISTGPFHPSNCGIEIEWPDAIRHFHSGKPLKNIELKINDSHSRGEALITDYGLEGNAVYPLIPEIRKVLARRQVPEVGIDFKPVNSLEQLMKKISGLDGRTRTYANAFNLNPVSLALIKAYTGKTDFTGPEKFILSIKDLRIPVSRLRPVEEAISTTGGLEIHELNHDYSLKRFPGVYCIGEMADWDAPTGGFLLQGCFSMGYSAARAISARSDHRK